MTKTLRTLFAAALAVAGPAIAIACIPGSQRFPICQSNADCAARKEAQEAPICFNLKCVACRYDTDCKAGEHCTSGNSCARTESTTPAQEETSEEATPQPKPEPETTPEDKPETKPEAKPVKKPQPRPVKKEGGGAAPSGADWSECAERCKDKTCLQQCTEKFEK
jgi:hypothetical protein